jgi:two-component system NarL family response regulator
MRRIRVLLADDQPAFRNLVRDILSSEPDIDVVAEAADGEDAIALATEHTPHVVLMDLRMPLLSGLEATRELARIHPNCKVLVLTVSDEEKDVIDAIHAGASGYLLKDVAIDEVAGAIRAVHAGEAVLSPAITPTLMTEVVASVRKDDHVALRPMLTGRELQILQLLAGGTTTTGIAFELGIVESVVNSHVHNVIRKLQLRDRVANVVHAIHDDPTGDDGP